MKAIQLILLLLVLHVHTNSAQRINEVIDSLGISIMTFSFHPDGEVIISTGYNREDGSQYLLLISDLDKPVATVDTLADNRPNRSAFSIDGRYLLYNIIDKMSDTQYTVKRWYYGDGKFGPPFYISEQLFLDNMYYYYMDDEENIYYYTFFREDRSRGGLLLSRFENGRYQKPEMIFPDRPNAVAFSPYLMDEETMLFVQHGVKDRTTDGVYYSIKEGDKWKDPVRLETLPYCPVISQVNDKTLALLESGSANIIFRDKQVLMDQIAKQERNK